MKKIENLKMPVQTIRGAVMVVILTGGLMSTLYAAEPDSAAPAPSTNSVTSPTNSVALNSTSAEVQKAAAKKRITGAELYSIHCNRCHPERYPTERTGAQWKTIMLHMQVRANIPVKQSRLILEYLQENSGR